MSTENSRAGGRAVAPGVFHLFVNGWGIGIGLLAIFACLIHFLVHDQASAVDVQLGAVAHGYYIAYGAAGLLVLIGLVSHRDDLDALGLALLIGGLSINLAAVIATIGVTEAIPSMATWLSLTVGAAGRLLVVTGTVRERPPPPSPEQIRRAIEDGEPL